MSQQPGQLFRTDVFSAVSLLKPYDLKEIKKVRIGPNRDGGYVMAEDFANSNDILSFGISAQIEFDADMARRGMQVYMYDHTIDGLPYDMPEFHFRKLGIGPREEPENLLHSLRQHLINDNLIDKSNLLLKMDVEGAEYDSILATPDAVLAQFRQIVIEIHWLSKLDEPEFCARFISFMQKLLENFVIFHVHANNCVPIVIRNCLAVADVIELSLIRKDVAAVQPSTTIFPTSLDCANAHWTQDHLLWFYPFIPSNHINNNDYVASLSRCQDSLRSYIDEYHTS